MKQWLDIKKKVKRKERPALFPKKVERQFVRGARRRSETSGTGFSGGWFSQYGYFLSVCLLWICFVGVLGHRVFFSDALSIVTLRVEGNSLVTTSEVTQRIWNALEGKRGYLVPRNNFLLLSPRHIEEQIVSALPLVRSAQVKRIFPDVLEVAVLERGSLVFWCAGSDGACWFLNESGTLENRPEAFEEHRVSKFFLVDESAQAVATGERVVTPEVLALVQQFSQALLEQFDIAVTDRAFLASKYADELLFHTSEGFSIRISTDMPLEKTLNTLRVVRARAIPEERLSDLRSVDLRVPGKAFYQLEDQVSEEALSAGDVPDVAPPPASD